MISTARLARTDLAEAYRMLRRLELSVSQRDYAGYGAVLLTWVVSSSDGSDLLFSIKPLPSPWMSVLAAAWFPQWLAGAESARTSSVATAFAFWEFAAAAQFTSMALVAGEFGELSRRRRGLMVGRLGHEFEDEYPG